MKTLRDRYWELHLGRSGINLRRHTPIDWCEKHYDNNIKTLNNEYFDDKLKMNVELKNYNENEIPNWFYFKYFIIDGEIVEMGQVAIEYLERLENIYHLEGIKHKIERIYEIN